MYMEREKQNHFSRHADKKLHRPEPGAVASLPARAQRHIYTPDPWRPPCSCPLFFLSREFGGMWDIVVACEGLAVLCLCKLSCLAVSGALGASQGSSLGAVGALLFEACGDSRAAASSSWGLGLLLVLSSASASAEALVLSLLLLLLWLSWPSEFSSISWMSGGMEPGISIFREMTRSAPGQNKYVNMKVTFKDTHHFLSNLTIVIIWRFLHIQHKSQPLMATAPVKRCD